MAAWERNCCGLMVTQLFLVDNGEGRRGKRRSKGKRNGRKNWKMTPKADATAMPWPFGDFKTPRKVCWSALQWRGVLLISTREKWHRCGEDVEAGRGREKAKQFASTGRNTICVSSERAFSMAAGETRSSHHFRNGERQEEEKVHSQRAEKRNACLWVAYTLVDVWNTNGGRECRKAGDGAWRRACCVCVCLEGSMFNLLWKF